MNLAHLKDKFAMIPERPDQTMEAYHIGNDNEMISSAINQSEDYERVCPKCGQEMYANCDGLVDSPAMPMGLRLSSIAALRLVTFSALISSLCFALSGDTSGTTSAICSFNPRAKPFCASVSALPICPYFLSSSLMA